MITYTYKGHQRAMEDAIKQHDVFQQTDNMLTSPPSEPFKVEDNYFTQLQWLSTQTTNLSPETKELITYWKDVSIMVISKIQIERGVK